MFANLQLIKTLNTNQYEKNSIYIIDGRVIDVMYI